MQTSTIDQASQPKILKIILASSRFAETCVAELAEQQPEQTVACCSTQDLLHHIRKETVDLLILDILFLQHQTQRFCWRLQDLYPELRIIVLGRTEAEISGSNWVYEYPNVSTACLSSQHAISTLPQTNQSPMTPDSQHLPSQTSILSAQETYLESVVGAAVFDLSGLPREYLVTDEVDNVGWVQTIFQALGLRSLLMSSLQLDGFHYASTCANGYRAIVVKQKNKYVALLLKPENSHSVSQDLITWSRAFDPDELKLHPQFRIA